MLELDDFQRDALALFDRTAGRAIYADDMGARKTATTLYWLNNRHFGGAPSERVLIVVPKTVHVDQWLDEASRWADRYTLYRGLGSKAAKTKRIAEWGSNGGLYITTYDGMKADKPALTKAKATGVVFDEGHNLKGRTTAVAKVANFFAKTALCLIVTGTPVLNKADELWQYLHMLYPQTYTSYWRWAREHFYVTLEHHGGRSHEVVGGFKEGHEEIVRAQLSGVIIQREIAELFPGEPWVEEPLFQTYPVELSDREKKLYRQLVEHQWGKTPTGIITASSKLVVHGRLVQLASDWGTFDTGADVGTKVRFAARDLGDWVQDGIPVLAFGTFRVTVDRLVAEFERYGLRAAAYHGGLSDADMAANLQAFKDGKLEMLAGTFKSMREGVDGAQYRTHKVGLVDLDWVPGYNDQAVGRAKRSGQSRRVEVRRYYAVNTVEESVYKTNLAKRNITRSLKGQKLLDVIYGGIDLADDGLLEFGDDEPTTEETP